MAYSLRNLKKLSISEQAMTKMKIKNYVVGGYKAFSEPHLPVDIAPVTIVIGHNNAGKSALVRTPILWADSLGSDSQILNLNARQLDFAHSYTDLFRADAGHPTMEFAFELQLSDRHFRLEIELLLVSTKRDSAKKLAVKRFHLCEAIESGTPLPGLPIEMSLEFQKDSGGIKYVPSIEGNRLDAVDDWSELLPLSPWLLTQLTKLNGGSATFSILMQLKKLGSAIHHLGPFRKLPQRQYQNPDVSPVIGSDGSNIVELLAWDRKNNGTLLDEVSSWFYNEPHFGFHLRLDGSSERAGFSSIHLVSDSGISVNLADAGSGIAQVLPLVVRRFQFDSSNWLDTLPTLQIIEQPELHLHPAACGTLGDLIVDAALAGSTDMLVETHSENLVLRVRRRIAEGKITSDQVAIYWVENEDGTSASVRRLNIDPDGWIEDWPDGVFAEDAAEARALSRAMRGHQ